MSAPVEVGPFGGLTRLCSVPEVLQVVLNAPEIAANTGNIIRLCANTGAGLHLVEPLGFDLAERNLRRAGLDYHELAEVRVHADLGVCLAALSNTTGRCFALSSRGERRYDEVRYQANDVVVFGAERSGLAEPVLAGFGPDRRLAIPMRPANRSLNLANAVAVVLYEGWRQLGFAGAGVRDGERDDDGVRSQPRPPNSLAESLASTAFDGEPDG